MLTHIDPSLSLYLVVKFSGGRTMEEVGVLPPGRKLWMVGVGVGLVVFALVTVLLR